jgi:hypothetical protein
VNRRRRLSVALALVAVGVFAQLLFGGETGPCLGPLGVTPVECAKVTGFVPGVGIGLPILATALLAALLVAVPALRPRRQVAIASAAGGGLVGALLFLALRPGTMEGLDSRGQWISVVRPIDGPALVVLAVVGALVGLVLATVTRARLNASG